MPTDTFSVAASGDDGFVSRDGTGEYPPTGTITATTNTSSDFGGQVRKTINTGVTFSQIQVGLFQFNTAALADDATVTAAVFRFSVTSLATDDARDLNFEYYDLGASIGTEDYAENVGTTAAQVAAATWQAWPTTGTVDVSLSNLSGINKTGFTGIRVGIDGGAPSDPSQTRINIAELDHTTRDEPKLLVTYTAGSSVLVQPPVRRVF
jgi:hypothetical protein